MSAIVARETSQFDAATLRFRQAQFRERLVMLRHLAETSDSRDEAEYLYRNLVQVTALLQRRFGLGKDAVTMEFRGVSLKVS